jgi:stage IV sporulation protein FB
VIFGEPERTEGDLRFVLFGIPVRVHPFFWLVGLLLGLHSPTAGAMIAWIAALFLGILVHELGHAAVMRSYGFYPSIVLYGMGGLAMHGPGQAFGARRPGFGGQILISAAGPLAGFALAALVSAGMHLAGHQVVVVKLARLVPMVFVAGPMESYFVGFVNDLLFISVFWGIINLLPVYPLDGGQIAREVALRLNPQDGIRVSLMISFVVAGLAAVVAFVQLGRDGVFMAILFGYLAVNSYVMLAAHSGRGPWG